MLNVGDLLGERYRLDERIATGGMGDVWRATDEVLRRVVAVKVLRPLLVDDPAFGSRFQAEARTIAALRHPGVIQVYDYGESGEIGDGHLAYLVMAHVDGQPLSQRIAAAGRLDPPETLSIVTQTAQALDAAHAAGVVHRDVKPANLLIQPDGQVVLVDFGVAVSAEATGLTAAHEVVGTALYMAPEQVSRRSVTPATDIYALGAVAYHCLAGHPPFVGDNALAVALRHLDDDPPPLPADVPPAVRDLVATAMAKDPADRFPTAAALAAAAEWAARNTAAAPPAFTPGVVLLPAAAMSADPPIDPPIDAPIDAAIDAPAGRRNRRRAIGATAGVLALLALTAVLAFADPAGTQPGPAQPPASNGPAPASVGPTQIADVSHPDATTGTPTGAAARSPGQPDATTVTPSGRPAATSKTRPAASPAPSPRPTTSPTGGPSPQPTTTDPQPTISQAQQTPSSSSPSPAGGQGAMSSPPVGN